jgi:hypothetical protein
MLFVLVMECFHTLICKADSEWLLQQLGQNDFCFRASLYADDVVAFFSPVELDLRSSKGCWPFSKEHMGLQQTSPRVMSIPSIAQTSRYLTHLFSKEKKVE